MTALVSVRVSAERFDVGAEIAALHAGRGDIGAVASFLGLCRDEDGALAALTLEHYPHMAEEELARIAHEARLHWPMLAALTIIHRFGRLLPGEPIVFVAVAASHRAPALAACDFLMDFLKTRAPFWKKEHFSDQRLEEAWVEASETDERRQQAWSRRLASQKE